MCNIEVNWSKNKHLEQISAKNPYVTFFLGHPVELSSWLFPKWPKILLTCIIQGDPKKMSHKDF